MGVISRYLSREGGEASGKVYSMRTTANGNSLSNNNGSK